MQWVEGICRVNGRMLLMAINEDGRRSNHSLDSLSKLRLKSKAAKTCRRRFSSDFKDWKLVLAKEYLAGSAIQAEVAERQKVFEFHEGKTRYLLPSQVLAKAMFRPFSMLSDVLFRPQGLEQLVSPDTDAEHGIQILDGLLRTYSKYNSDTVRQPLAWFWNLASARKCWNSVYANAVDGRLGIQLPIGQARLVVTGTIQDATFFVTDVTILDVMTTEPALSKDQCVGPVIPFHVITDGGAGMPVPDMSNAKINSSPGVLMSDAEWAEIAPIVVSPMSSGPRKHDLRAQVEGVLMKQSSGLPWRKVSFQSGTWMCAAKLYRSWRRSGTWEKVIRTLEQHRAYQMTG